MACFFPQLWWKFLNAMNTPNNWIVKWKRQIRNIAWSNGWHSVGSVRMLSSVEWRKFHDKQRRRDGENGCGWRMNTHWKSFIIALMYAKPVRIWCEKWNLGYVIFPVWSLIMAKSWLNVSNQWRVREEKETSSHHTKTEFKRRMCALVLITENPKHNVLVLVHCHFFSLHGFNRVQLWSNHLIVIVGCVCVCE